MTNMLDCDEIRANERNVVNLAEGAHNARMINSGNEHCQEVSQEGWLFLKIECQGFVVTIIDVSICAILTTFQLTSQHWRPAQSRP